MTPFRQQRPPRPIKTPVRLASLATCQRTTSQQATSATPFFEGCTDLSSLSRSKLGQRQRPIQVETQGAQFIDRENTIPNVALDPAPLVARQPRLLRRSFGYKSRKTNLHPPSKHSTALQKACFLPTGREDDDLVR